MKEPHARYDLKADAQHTLHSHRWLITAPLWELASSLEYLHIDLEYNQDFASKVYKADIDEVTSEDDFPSLRVPYPSKPAKGSKPRANDELHYVIACRTIATAAKGGQLKAIYFHADQVEEPFAMRSLVTAWVYGAVNGYDNWYLPWFEEDAELAQQVSDAWNTILARNDEDIWCKCSRCERLLLLCRDREVPRGNSY